MIMQEHGWRTCQITGGQLGCSTSAEVAEWVFSAGDDGADGVDDDGDGKAGCLSLGLGS